MNEREGKRQPSRFSDEMVRSDANNDKRHLHVLNQVNDMSRERRSPENFHPPAHRHESNEVNEVDAPSSARGSIRHESQIPFSPRMQHM